MKTWLIKRCDKIILALIVMLTALMVHACDDPDEPQPEYGVVPMYGVPSAVVENQKTTLQDQP